MKTDKSRFMKKKTKIIVFTPLTIIAGIALYLLTLPVGRLPHPAGYNVEAYYKLKDLCKLHSVYVNTGRRPQAVESLEVLIAYAQENEREVPSISTYNPYDGSHTRVVYIKPDRPEGDPGKLLFIFRDPILRYEKSYPEEETDPEDLEYYGVRSDGTIKFLEMKPPELIQWEKEQAKVE